MSLLAAALTLGAPAATEPTQATPGAPPPELLPAGRTARDAAIPEEAADRKDRPIVAYRPGELEIDDPFWSPVLRTNRRQTLYHIWTMCDRTGRIANFQRAAGKSKGPHQGRPYDDSDVYKLVEGTAYAVRDSKDEFMEARLAELTQLIAQAQRPDGYLNTYYQLGDLSKRWTDLPHMHELYCLGHLMEAGVGCWDALGSRALLDVGSKAASHIGSVFGPGKRREVCGHPEIELALQRLNEVTGDKAQDALATWFLEERGHSEGRPSAGAYAQDHLPLRQQEEAVGHAVRAAYLYTAAANMARRNQDDGMAEAMRRLFADVTTRKMYLTGGIGTSAENEGFTRAHDLPNDGGYAETCAAIGLVLWAHQMHLLDRDSRPVNALERALYNAVRGGVSLDGVKFFYSNPLASHGAHHRQSWFDCACCPPNILRLLGRLDEFIASRDGETVYINLFVQSTVGVTFGRASFQITQRTEYPWDGEVKLWVVGTRPTNFTLALRIPDWAEGATITVDNKPVEPVMDRGYARITREWDGNNTVVLALPMPVRVVQADPQVESQQGRFALQRGPIVYCVEGVDSAPDLRSLVFDPTQEFVVERKPDLLGDVTVIRGTASRPAVDGGTDESVPFTAVPFYAWNNRAPGPMLVWLPSSAAFADPPSSSRVLAGASRCGPQDTLAALSDGDVPESRSPRFTWWPRRGASAGAAGGPSAEWVQYEFDQPRLVDGVEMVWFDDLDQGGACAVPASVVVEVRRAGSSAWVQVAAKELERPPSVGSLGADAPRTTLTFDAVEVAGIRLKCVLREDSSAGLLEWQVRGGT